MSNHTPGPWIDFGADVRTANSRQAVSLVSMQREEWESNARLIAAAPDLLETLERVVYTALNSTVADLTIAVREAQDLIDRLRSQ